MLGYYHVSFSPTVVAGLELFLYFLYSLQSHAQVLDYERLTARLYWLPKLQAPKATDGCVSAVT